MQVTAKFVNPPKEGKKLATIKDQNDNYHYYDPKKFTFNKGQTYEVEVAVQPFNGKDYSHIKSMKASEAPAQNPAPKMNGAFNSAERWWMPFVSNTVAHALQAGRIESPNDIGAWAQAAKNCAVALDRPLAGRIEDMESDLPWEP